MNEPQKSPCNAIVQNSLLTAVGNHWPVSRLLWGLGIIFCLIGLVMASHETDVESMQPFRESFHKMIGTPSSPYRFAQAAVIFYLVPGAVMIALSFRKPTIARSVSSFFGALMFSIILVTCLYGRLSGFLFFQMLVCIGLVCYGYGLPKFARS